MINLDRQSSSLTKCHLDRLRRRILIEVWLQPDLHSHQLQRDLTQVLVSLKIFSWESRLHYSSRSTLCVRFFLYGVQFSDRSVQIDSLLSVSANSLCDYPALSALCVSFIGKISQTESSFCFINYHGVCVESKMAEGAITPTNGRQRWPGPPSCNNSFQSACCHV